MHKRTLAIVATILGIGIVMTMLILRTEPPRPAAVEDSAESEPLDYPRGPHGARLLSDGALQVEVTMYETSVPPHFRVYPFDDALQPLPPKDVTLQIELHRLGGRVDRINFHPEANYLRGDAVVEEPHSFDVKVTAQHASRQYHWSYSQSEGKVQLGPAQIESTGITINTVAPREMVTTLELPGVVETDKTRLAHVVPRLQGVVSAVRKQEGDRVRPGELLAVVNSRELADVKGAYLAATQHVEFARVTLTREETLWKKKISAEREYLDAKRAFDEAKLAQKLAAQKLVVLGVRSADLPSLASAPAETMARYEIRSPLDGIVLERDITVGEAVTAEQKIFTVADLSTIWVDISVYAKDLGAVHEGQQAVVVSTDLQTEVPGRISYVGPLVGQETRTATARIVLPNPGTRWRPGLFVTVRLVRERTTVALAVAADAIQTFRDWQVVFVKYGDWFEARPVELGRSDGQWVEVLRGLTPGEQYATANSFAVKAEIGKLGAAHDH
jgi:membrane fusion protein, heavy metal efflux system